MCGGTGIMYGKQGKQGLIKCSMCSAFLKYDKIEHHMKTAHNISSFNLKKLVIHEGTNMSASIKKNTVNDSIGKSAADQKKLKLGILAPVKETYLERGVRDIYTLYNKVSFGSDMSTTEMLGIQQYLKSLRVIFPEACFE
jgi:hypothetical protein